MPTLSLMLLVMVDDFLNDKVQKFLGKFRVEIGPFCKIFEPRDLRGLAGGVRRWQIVLCLEFAHGLGVLKALAQRVDQDRIKAIN